MKDFRGRTVWAQKEQEMEDEPKRAEMGRITKELDEKEARKKQRV